MKDQTLTRQAQDAIARGIPEAQLFTPMVENRRVVMKISREEKRLITRGPGYKGTVKDQLTGKSYKVYGRACSLPNCFCDAQAEEA